MYTDSLSFSQINIRSLRSNIDLLLAFLKTSPFSIICLTETWTSLDDTDVFSLCNNSNYNRFLRPRTSCRGVGVGILVNMDSQPHSIYYIALSYGEFMYCTIRLKCNSHSNLSSTKI